MIEDHVRAFLDEPRFAVLATIAEDGVPHQTVMWYALEDDTIIMNTARGRVKDKHVQRDRRVSFCVEDGYRYVTVTGQVELNDDQEVAQADIAMLARRYEPGKADRMIQNFQRQKRISMYLRVEQIIASGFDE